MNDHINNKTRREILLGGLAAATGMAVTGPASAQTKPGARFRIAVTGDFENLAPKLVPWQTLGDDVEVVTFDKPFRSAQETVKALREFDAVTLMHERIPLSRPMLEQLPRLKLIVFSGNSNETLDDKAATERNIIVYKSAPDIGGDPALGGGDSPSELALALMLACARHVPEADALIRKGGWSMAVGIPLRGKVLGIIGYGDVGRPVGIYGRALGMKVLGFSRSLTDETARADGITRTDLQTLLRTSDVVSIHLPLTAQTRGFIGAKEIALLKPSVIFINTARAAIVDEPALLEALRTRRIAMAGLDVFWQEPMPADHPLLQLPNVVMTPHVGYVTEETMVVRYRALLEVLAAYRQGKVMERYVSKPRV
jgi:phosphoglycerate dehydrogenase-like enzyme